MDGKIIVTGITSLAFTIIMYFVCRTDFPTAALPVSIIMGLVFYVLLYPVIWLILKHQEKKYSEAEKTISQPVSCKINANITTNNLARNCCIYLCETELLIISLDKKPNFIERYPLNDINFCSGNEFTLNIHLKNGTVGSFTSDEVEIMRKALTEKLHK